MMLNQNFERIKVWLQIVAFILLLLGVFSFRLNEVGNLPLGDETYHITDGLVNQPYTSFNDFQEMHYQFAGHPLGYPLSLKVAFSLFGPSVKTARFHSLFFSFMALFAFFLIIREYLYFPAAVLITMALYASTAFYNLTPAILGDMSFLTFCLFTIYFLYREKYWSAALAAFLATFFREAALALSVGILSAYILIRWKFPKDQPGFKKIFITVFPGLAFLFAFFINNKIRYHSFSLHPYALGTLLHTNVHFFGWSPTKWASLQYIKSILLINVPSIFLLWLTFSLCYLVAKKKIDRRLPPFCFAFYAGFVFLFFCFYGDTISRDILPVICFLFFLLAYTLQAVRKSLQIIAAAVILISGISRLSITDNTPEIEADKIAAHIIEQNYLGKQIYAALSFSDQKIAGYFSKTIYLQGLYAPKLDVIVLSSQVNAFERRKILDVAKKQGLVPTRQFKIQHLTLHVFEKPQSHALKIQR